MKKQLFWAFVIALVITAVNFAITGLMTFYSTWSIWKDILFFCIEAVMLWLWMAILLAIHNRIKA